MTLGHIERYSIEQGADGIVVRMRQGRPALGVTLLTFVVLCVSWWFGPYGPRPTEPWASADWFYWIWCAFFLVALFLGLLGAMHKEDWTIATGRTLAVRIDQLVGGDDNPVFPFELRLLDAEGKGRVIALQRPSSVDQFLQALRTVLTLDVEDTRKVPH